MIAAIRRRHSNPHESLPAMKIVAWTVALLLVLPLLVVVGLALNESRYLTFPPERFSTHWLQEVANSEMWRRAFLQSVVVAGLAAPLATILAACAALGTRGLRHARYIQALVMLPLIVPLIVTALAIYPLWIELNLTGTTVGLVLAHALLALPFAFLTIMGSIYALDPDLERAAASLGATRVQTLRRVTIPLITPALLMGLIVAAAVSFDDIVVTLFLASPETRTVPVVLWTHLREFLGPTVAAASVFIATINIIIMLSAVIVGRWMIKRRAGAQVDD